MSENQISVPFSEPLARASGPIDYGLTNDYMFRAVLQQNNRVLKGLICSLLHLDPADVLSVEIINPIYPGDKLDAKEFILDIDVTLNNALLINLEMQVFNSRNWPDRSLSYLCRRFDQLGRGEDYLLCKPVMHIGFLDFTPFADRAEFYATYKLLNVKNHHLYSDKFTLCVVDLTQTELATEEDKAYDIDCRARLFKATTWEELKMIANDNPAITDACEGLYRLNADEIARQKSRARQDAIALENALHRTIAEQADKLKNQESQLESQTAQLESQTAQLKKLSATIVALQAELDRYRRGEVTE